MVAIVGDAELDEGNVYEALLEGWKHDVRNLWWVIDYNRQSLDRVVPERLFAKIEQFFATVGWRVVTIKYGKKLQAAFARPGGEALRDWIDDCPNDLYAALCFKGGAAWRAHLESDLGRNPGIRALLDGHDDDALARADDQSRRPRSRGRAGGLPRRRRTTGRTASSPTPSRAGACRWPATRTTIPGLMTPEQMAASAERAWRARRRGMVTVAPGSTSAGRARGVPRRRALQRGGVERHDAAPVPVPDVCRRAGATEAGVDPGGVRPDHGRARARATCRWPRRIVTTSPDVTVSTNLGGWVSRRGVFSRREHEDVFRAEQVLSPTRGGRAGPASISSWASPRTTCS